MSQESSIFVGTKFKHPTPKTIYKNGEKTLLYIPRKKINVG